MLTISDPRAINSLPLGNKVKSALMEVLVEPFNGIEETTEQWAELDCRLVMLEAADKTDSPVDDHHRVSDLVDHPEFIETLNEDWLLALTITDQAGSGIYLLYRKDQLATNPL